MSPHHSYPQPIPSPAFTMALATKTQSQNIFAKLKSKPGNKVCVRRKGASIAANI
jgi:hypothetical protein